MDYVALPYAWYPMQILLCFLLFLSMAAFQIKADNGLPADEAPIPPEQWETYATEGISVAVVLRTEKSNDKLTDILLIYIKNISTDEKNSASGGHDDGCRIFYTDGDGIRHDLHPINPYNKIVLKLSVHKIPPGDLDIIKIDLSPSDVIFLTSHPIQCNFSVWDSTKNVRNEITTAPKRFYLPQ